MDYVSIRQLANQGQVSYDEKAGARKVAEEEWAKDVFVSPAEVRFNVSGVNYEHEGCTGMNFHFTPDIELDSVKGDIRTLNSRRPYSSRVAIAVNDENVVIHLSPLGSRNVPRLEVVVNTKRIILK